MAKKQAEDLRNWKENEESARKAYMEKYNKEMKEQALITVTSMPIDDNQEIEGEKCKKYKKLIYQESWFDVVRFGSAQFENS